MTLTVASVCTSFGDNGAQNVDKCLCPSLDSFYIQTERLYSLLSTFQAMRLRVSKSKIRLARYDKNK